MGFPLAQNDIKLSLIKLFSISRCSLFYSFFYLGNQSFRAIDAHLTPPSCAVHLGAGSLSTLGASWRGLLFSERRADVHFRVGDETLPM